VEDQTFETLETADLLDISWTRHDGRQGWIVISGHVYRSNLIGQDPLIRLIRPVTVYEDVDDEPVDLQLSYSSWSPAYLNLVPVTCKSGLEKIRIVSMTGTRNNERKKNSGWDLSNTVRHS